MNIKKQFLFVVILLTVFSTSFLVGELALAQETKPGLQYQLLEKIPGTSGLGSDLPGYVSAIYKMALVIVTLSAVLMLSIGGFMYLTSAGNTASIGTAKGIIYDSLIGLVIALSAWLVLYVINPDLVEINLSALAPVAPIGGNPASAPGSVGTLPSGSDSDLAYKILANKNISLNAGGDCSSASGTVSPQKNLADISQGRKASACSNGCQTKGSAGCTDNAVNLSNKMLSAIVAVGEKNQFTITSISGGPHSTTSAHFRGTAIDISPATQTLMDAFLGVGAYPPKDQSASMCEDKNGKNVGCAPGSGADHIHLVFPN